MPKCHAKSKQSGEQCKKWALVGQGVCHIHGGNSPQALKAARIRLLEMADPALAALDKIVTSSESDQVKLAAAKDILDRIGLAGIQKIEVSTDMAEVLQRAEALEAQALKQKVSQN